MSEVNALPSNWTTTTLGEILLNPKKDLVDGPFGSNLKSSEYGCIGIPVFKIQNIKANRFIDKKIDHITEEKAATISRHSFQSGDLIITKLGNPLGLCCKVPDKYSYGIIVADLMRLRPSSTCINTDLLVYLVNSRIVQHQFQKITKGTTRSRVNLTIVRDITIPLPPLLEQHRIVAKIEELFSSLDKGIENLRNAQAQLKTYRQAVLKWAFEGKLTNKNVKEGELPEGWMFLRLGTIIEKPKYGTSKKCEYGVDGIGVLRIPNIGNGHINSADLKFASFDTDEANDLRLKEGDILTIRSNGSVDLVGKCALINKKDEKFLYAGYLIRLRPIPKYVLPKYVVYALNSKELRIQIESKAKSTSGVNNINSEELRSLILPVCSLAEQYRIVSEIESRISVCDKLEESIFQSLSKAEALRQSILKRAFEGKLVPQDPNDEPAGILLERIRTERQNTQPVKKTRNTKKKENAKRN